jgi:ribonuclease BN (tRNA processing enzyme)
MGAGKAMKLTVIGSSDAFGSGGRLQTCFHVEHAAGEFLIDCGATSLIGLTRAGLDPGRISAIFITHLHGDHFAGLAWWLIHALHMAKRSAPLTVAGPRGLEQRFLTLAEAVFPGSTATPRSFDLIFIEYSERAPLQAGAVCVTPFEVSHPSGAPPYALRFAIEDRTIAFSGDTEWTESLVPAASGADLFICECSAFEKEARFHLNWRTIEKNLERLGSKAFLLTHMGPEMLANRSAVSDPRVRFAEDGLVMEV